MVAHHVLDMDEVVAWLMRYGEEEAARFVLQAILDAQAEPDPLLRLVTDKT